MFKRILLAVDGSEHSIRATEYSIELANKFDGTVDVVYVVDGDTVKKDVLQTSTPFEMEKYRKEKVKPIRSRLNESNVIFGTHFLQGEPGQTIVNFANDREFDCVVIGSRGLNELQTLFLGSVSHKVVKRANCPVLIVK
ncbi:universal stress protein [Oceanobacillus alkalisoli]|uniref:universal stress protein n=1 Tax=Oceanobacillus alkalisoli TaxID=2925113 RepID=UPI001EF07A70|nr:universal stress protein [Oceanobacillus alkalisoli]MCF3944441.1 universal stress protein [Oceanobacillus alkalisoli]MCG5102098.1 universal stress protein [Oceanobacillus alkalisoli]